MTADALDCREVAAGLNKVGDGGMAHDVWRYELGIQSRADHRVAERAIHAGPVTGGTV